MLICFKDMDMQGWGESSYTRLHACMHPILSCISNLSRVIVQVHKLILKRDGPCSDVIQLE